MASVPLPPVRPALPSPPLPPVTILAFAVGKSAGVPARSSPAAMFPSAAFRRRCRHRYRCRRCRRCGTAGGGAVRAQCGDPAGSGVAALGATGAVTPGAALRCAAGDSAGPTGGVSALPPLPPVPPPVASHLHRRSTYRWAVPPGPPAFRLFRKVDVTPLRMSELPPLPPMLLAPVASPPAPPVDCP